MVTVLLERWNTNAVGLIKIILLEFNWQCVHFLFTSVPHVTGWIYVQNRGEGVGEGGRRNVIKGRFGKFLFLQT